MSKDIVLQGKHVLFLKRCELKNITYKFLKLYQGNYYIIGILIIKNSEINLSLGI